MASLLSTWQLRRITWMLYGSFWRTTPARVWPRRYCMWLGLNVCASSVSPYVTVCFHALVMSCLYICCTNTFISSSVSLPVFLPFLPLSPRPVQPCVSLYLFLNPSVPHGSSLFLFLSVSHSHSVYISVFSPSSSACPSSTSFPPSLPISL